MSNCLIPVKDYYHKPYPKNRKARTPEPNKIGDIVSSISKVEELANNHMSVVIDRSEDSHVYPAACLLNWNHSYLKARLEKGSIKEYIK